MSEDLNRHADAATPRTRERTVSWVLLLASGASMALLVYAMVQENFLTPWRGIQRRYVSMLEGSGDPKQQQLARDFAVDLRQVDLPQLGTVDRCVACHVGLDNPAMATADQPFRTHSGQVLDHHPVAEYGCTPCHRGQGAATNLTEAKAVGVHWDYPLLPAGLTQSSCGMCHGADSALMQEHAPKLALGRRLFVERGCQSCHKLGGRGGQLGPALDGIGWKTTHVLPMVNVQGEPTLASWISEHFDDPQRIVAGSQMPPPRLTPAENLALTVYMLSLQGRALPHDYIARDKVAEWHTARNVPTTQGAELYAQHCKTCHGEGTHGRWYAFFDQFAPAIRGPGLRAMADRAYLRAAVAKGRPGTLMPGWDATGGGLSDVQVDAIVSYLAAGDGRPVQPLRPAPDNLSAGQAARGAQLFIQQCSACHGNAGQGRLGPALANPAFLSQATDALLANTVVNGRQDTAMPAFQQPDGSGLSDQEVRDLVAFVRSLGPRAVSQR
jgi:mono/diheme cytochrome c family protein